MYKYWIVFTNTLQKALIYRARIVTYFLLGSVVPFIMIAIWTQYYASGKTISGFTLPQLITYYLAVILIRLWTSKVHENVKDDIRDGELSNFVLKPFDYFGYRLFWEAGWYVVKSVLISLPLLLVLHAFGPNLHLSFNPLALPAFILSYLVSYSLSMIIGLISFYITETTGIENFYNMLVELASGRTLPLSFFPGIFATIINFLPFKYIISFPALILVGKLSTPEIYTGLVLQFTWFIIFISLDKLLWYTGIKKFSAIGL